MTRKINPDGTLEGYEFTEGYDPRDEVPVYPEGDLIDLTNYNSKYIIQLCQNSRKQEKSANIMQLITRCGYLASSAGEKDGLFLGGGNLLT